MRARVVVGVVGVVWRVVVGVVVATARDKRLEINIYRTAIGHSGGI
jgi:hypothetical protein